MRWMNTIQLGDAFELVQELPENSIDCVVTSPPYWGKRNNDDQEKQIGLESAWQDYVEALRAFFDLVKKPLKDAGTVWLNLGDTRSGSGGPGSQYASRQGFKKFENPNKKVKGFQRKNLLGIPWRVALALQESGWILRSDIIWTKPNPMVESVKDRPTDAHEHIFLLTQSVNYYYDWEAIKERGTIPAGTRAAKGTNKRKDVEGVNGRPAEYYTYDGYRNKRNVWKVQTRPGGGNHYSTFPEQLILPCILAGCPVDGVVLDPFAGTGTTAMVALKNYRNFIGFELSPAYRDMATERLSSFTNQSDLFRGIM